MIQLMMTGKKKTIPDIAYIRDCCFGGVCNKKLFCGQPNGVTVITKVKIPVPVSPRKSITTVNIPTYLSFLRSLMKF